MLSSRVRGSWGSGGFPPRPRPAREASAHLTGSPGWHEGKAEGPDGFASGSGKGAERPEVRPAVVLEGWPPTSRACHLCACQKCRVSGPLLPVVQHIWGWEQEIG